MLRCVSVAALIWLLAGCSPEPDKPEPPAAPQVQTEQAAAQSAPVATAAVAPVAEGLQVYKSPTCGCCGLWVDHMREADFQLTVTDVQSLTELKQKLGVPVDLQSCHTTQTPDGKYYFEGHVPAPVVAKFLASPPANAVGLAVPNMPVGSPGMEMGDRFMPYDVLVVFDNGSTDVFARMEDQAAQYN